MNKIGIIVLSILIGYFVLVLLQSPNDNMRQIENKSINSTRQLYNGNLSNAQIDKICMTSLSELNNNPISNYIRISNDTNAKKYVYQSKETLYKYSCGFTGQDTFYINGEGWEDIIPRGTLYYGMKENCVSFDLYDPAFKLTHTFTICN